jgi:3D (Asp-Asp-Asp) domain-containing protein
MSKTFSTASFARLGRWSSGVAAALLSMGLLGAAQPDHAKKPQAATVAEVKASESVDVEPSAQPELASFKIEAPATELLHEVSAEPAPVVTPAPAVKKLSASAKKSRQLWLQVTAYCSCKKCCGPGARGLTASGRNIRYNGGLFVAADTRLLPFGTKLVVPGYGDEKPVEVIDRGGAIKGHHIDLFFPTHEQAKEWGVKWMQVTVVD